MSPRLSTLAIGLVTVAAYLARPWSCMVALQLEVVPPDDPYHSVDPHGFGVMGAVWMALLMMGPVLWLLLQRRQPGVPPGLPAGRVVAILPAVATPMLIQLTYLDMPFAWCWPIMAASALWAAVVLALCLRTRPGSLSAHAAFDRFPKAAWTLVSAIGVSKAALFVLVMP